MPLIISSSQEILLTDIKNEVPDDFLDNVLYIMHVNYTTGTGTSKYVDDHPNKQWSSNDLGIRGSRFVLFQN